MSFISASSVTTRQHVLQQSYQNMTSFQTAQAGLDYSIPYLTDNADTIGDGDGITVNLSGGNYFTLVFEFLDGKNLIRVHSTGHAGDGSGSHAIEHIVHYIEGEKTIMPSYAVQARGELAMFNNADISDLSGSLYTARLGGDADLNHSASTTLSSGEASTRSGIGEDIVRFDTEILSSSDADLELAFLGIALATYLEATPTLTLPAQTGNYDYQADINGVVGETILITHSGGSANFGSLSYLGTATDPVILVVNLDGAGTFRMQNNTEIYGKVIVNNGTASIENSAVIHGNLIVDGNLQLGNNVTIDGDVIATGNVQMQNSSEVNGAVFALGDVNLENNVTINGALMSGGEITMKNSAQVIYNPENAAISIPGEKTATGYAKISGSWTDLSSP